VKKIDRLMRDIEYYSFQFRNCGNALVEIAEEQSKLRKSGIKDPYLSALLKSAMQSYSIVAISTVETGQEVLAMIPPAGEAVGNPYELDLRKFEHMFQMARQNAMTAEHQVRRLSRTKGEPYRRAVRVHKALVRQAKDAAYAVLIVADRLGKRTRDWEEKLGIGDWL
jgi:hypothetical protein